MSVRHALLAVLTEGTCYGYQLRTEFSRRTGTTAPLNVGQVYNTLDRLERDGFVTKGAMDDAGHVPYTITAAGAAEVEAWLSASVGGVGARDELVVKVTLALSLPDADAREVVRIQREVSLAEAAALARARERLEAESRDRALARLLSVEAQEAQVHARLAWLDAAERRIGDARATGTRPAGLAAAPRRGRPARAPGGSAD
ncbi:PadR family transcriptional regulator [Clavibacter sp. VKM Ac-2872]|uniref:PadR family transcriptional regulator n=1 Tax=Clavibacter sp. VKM Ac-2872 TaxID=2783812 RepID=UPI00188AF7F2|nr:PadR family transcriptional regulator [Clavibacter sp. VKM Ac-2872]MBF4624231.1 PadR family transcriptional regulator [Clavibacter sp. VKM Ac-2872]